MKIVALVQARMGSTRFPGKVLKPVAGMTMIEVLLSRLSKSNELDEIILVTSKNRENDQLQSVVESIGFKCYRGSENNVLNRFYMAAKDADADVVVRITGDCPLVDPSIVDECINRYKKSKVDYFSNVDPATYPDGLDVEVMSFSSVEHANSKAKSKFDMEHVTPYIRNSNKFLKASIELDKDLSSLRLSVDEYEDLVVIKNVFEYFGLNLSYFSIGGKY